MITHGILSAIGTWDSMIHEVDVIREFDIKLKPKKINWKKTKVYDNSNRGQRKAIYKERWK